MTQERKQTPPVCSKTVYGRGRWPQPHGCIRNGSVERDGKWYCAQHDPVAKKERDAERRAAADARWAVIEKQRKLEAAAPALLQALEAHDAADKSVTLAQERELRAAATALTRSALALAKGEE